jgi:hypothetical protein
MGGISWVPHPFDPAMFPAGTRTFYCYWCYRNTPGEVCKQRPEMRRGEWWMRIRFDHLKQPRWVPVTSQLGCHLSLTPFEGSEEETLYRRNIDWVQMQRDFLKRLRPFLTRENIEKLRGDFSDEVLNEALRFLRPHERLTNQQGKERNQ